MVLRSHCKTPASVQIARAQFEVSQGNTIKAASILHKAMRLKTKPGELLETSMGNILGGKDNNLRDQTMLPNIYCVKNKNTFIFK